MKTFGLFSAILVFLTESPQLADLGLGFSNRTWRNRIHLKRSMRNPALTGLLCDLPLSCTPLSIATLIISVLATLGAKPHLALWDKESSAIVPCTDAQFPVVKVFHPKRVIEGRSNSRGVYIRHFKSDPV